MANNTDSDNQWHLDKKVPITLIFVLVCQIGAGVWAIADIKKDVELLKADAIALHKTDDHHTEMVKESFRAFQAQLDRLDAKLDRLIERR